MSPKSSHARTFFLLCRQRGIVVLAALLLLAGAASSRPSGDSKAPALSANDLVRRATQRELQEEGQPHYLMYRARREQPAGTRVTLRVETPQGPVGRLLSLNDRPLTAEEQQAVKKDMERILSDPSWLRKQQKQYQDESERRRRALGVMADAFLFDYDGAEPDGRVRLKFRPNPKFDPPFREAQAFPGMEGKVWLDAQGERVLRIETRLFRDVDFGWGIVGRLYKGGHIEIENSQTADGTWRITTINVNLDYRILFSYQHAQQKVSYSDFRPVPSNLTLTQAVDLLRQTEPLGDPKK